MTDDTGQLGGLQEHIEQSRRAKATHIAVWLEHADPWCRACRRPLRRDDLEPDPVWLDAATEDRFCRAPGFKRAGALVPHRPDPWTPARVEHLDEKERALIAERAGTKRPSEQTWAVVVELFTKLYEKHHPVST
jgi:hypothetical protein